MFSELLSEFPCASPPAFVTGKCSLDDWMNWGSFAPSSCARGSSTESVLASDDFAKLGSVDQRDGFG